MIIDASSLDRVHAYKLLKGSIIPRAIGWVSTVSKDGIGNLAPISFFTGAGPHAPSVFLDVQPRSDGVTPKVISHTKQAVASTEIAASF